MFEVVGNKSMAKVIYFGIFNFCKPKVSFNCGTDISNKEWPA